MADFQIRFEWEDGSGVRGPELAATWARLEIVVDGQIITEKEDLGSKSIRRGLSIPLYPVAEWLACNWWWLWYEDRAWQTPDETLSRHSFLAAREGFPLPALEFWPQHDSMRLRCEAVEHAPSRSRFLHSRDTWAPKNSVRDQVGTLIAAVVERLEDRGVFRTYLQEEWARVSAAEANEGDRRACEFAARLGADPFAIDAEVGAGIDLACQELPEPIWKDFFDSANPEDLAHQSIGLADFLNGARRHGGGPGWGRLKRSVPAPDSARKPWDQGYELARSVRAYGALQEERFLDGAEQILEALHVPEYIEILQPGPWDSAAGLSMTESPVFGLACRRPESRKFALSRALGEALAQPTPAPILLTKSSGSLTQKRSRAFAAEFLAPAELIRRELGSTAHSVTDADCEELAYRFGVSPFVIRDQIINHGIAHYPATAGWL